MDSVDMKFLPPLLLVVLLTGCTTIYTGDITPIRPGIVDPENAVAASPGQTYYNKSNNTFWEKVGGSGKRGWKQLL